MSWFELGFSSGKISITQLLKNSKISADAAKISINNIIERIIIGDWPVNIDKNIEIAGRINKAYNRLNY
ncbi:MAG: hypothetical protein LBU29_00300 [Endomicrobium sp.]|nr:hypothetical protein [Endomicrobium sp.]